MPKPLYWIQFLLSCYTLTTFNESSQNTISASENIFFEDDINPNSIDQKKILLTSDFLDAAISSFNSFNSLIKKESYRTKITSFNNPASSDMGFNLEQEIQIALKPLLSKARATNTSKFSEIVSGLVTAYNEYKNPVSATPIFSSIMSFVGSLTLHEKRITRKDLDTFVMNVSKYFVQYEKLNQANLFFDQNIEKLNSKLKDLQFDIREFMLDLLAIVYKDVPRDNIKHLNAEELYLKYLDKAKLSQTFTPTSASAQDAFLKKIKFPSDGMKTAKDIAHDLQKLFNEYQKIYSDNYIQIRNILLETKNLGVNINTQQIDSSLADLQALYDESKSSDVLGLRLNTLFARLKTLTSTEQEATSK